MSGLDAIITEGTWPSVARHARLGALPDNWVRCVDGFVLSVLTGRADAGPGPYTVADEVAIPRSRRQPASWQGWRHAGPADGLVTYGPVPVDAVRDLVTAHGGEAGS